MSGKDDQCTPQWRVNELNNDRQAILMFMWTKFPKSFLIVIL